MALFTVVSALAFELLGARLELRVLCYKPYIFMIMEIMFIVHTGRFASKLESQLDVFLPPPS